MNSAHGSCRLRSWAVPVLGTGDAEWLPGGGLLWIWLTRKLPEGGTIYAGPIHQPRIELSDPAVSTATPCRNQASVPVIDMR